MTFQSPLDTNTHPRASWSWLSLSLGLLLRWWNDACQPSMVPGTQEAHNKPKFLFFSLGYSFAATINLLLEAALAKHPDCLAEVLSAGWCRDCFPPVLEAWDTPLLSPNPPYLRISLSSLLLGALGGHPPASPPLQMPAFLGLVLKSPGLKARLASPLHGCWHPLQDGGEHPASSSRVTVLCALQCQQVLPRRSGWAGAERMEQAWGRSRGTSPGACISAEQPGGCANKYQTLQRGNKLSPHC